MIRFQHHKGKTEQVVSAVTSNIGVLRGILHNDHNTNVVDVSGKEYAELVRKENEKRRRLGYNISNEDEVCSLLEEYVTRVCYHRNGQITLIRKEIS